MTRKGKIAAFAAALISMLAAGCGTDQSRTRGRAYGETPPDVMVHGRRAGGEVSEFFGKDSTRDKLDPMLGDDRGFIVTMLYLVEIAPEATDPTVLERVGYVRKLEEDRGEAYMFEFHDVNGNRIGWLTPRGELYRHQRATREFVGAYQIEDAAKLLYRPPTGYGYDAVKSDISRGRMDDPEVVEKSPEQRGVIHRTHRSYPPVIVLTLLDPGEAKRHGDGFAKEIAAARTEERINRLREEAKPEDGEYGGLEFKDGNPVDENGKPLKPGDTGK